MTAIDVKPDTRRRRLVLAAGAACAGALPARAEQRCVPMPIGRRCEVQIPMRRFVPAFAYQKTNQWCWAASISMVFRYYGYEVSQPRIVQEAYGAIVNMPAVNGLTIARQINRGWRDDRGRSFAARLTGVFDAMAGAAAISNDQILRELAAEHPLILGARSHAMVLTALAFDQPRGGPPMIWNGGVFDPLVGPRGTAPDEIRPAGAGGSMLFLAAIRIGRS